MLVTVFTFLNIQSHPPPSFTKIKADIVIVTANTNPKVTSRYFGICVYFSVSVHYS